MEFNQSTALPLDFGYNAYWPLTASELKSSSDKSQLLPTGKPSEILLSRAPAYQPGPFGDYYISYPSALINAGSTNAGAVGLYHYTTRIDQTKDADQSYVNIGKHYVAADTYSGLPKDSDSDGIPDYVEDANGNGQVDANETSPVLPASDGVTADIYNSVYDDIDLSGSGIVGRIKRALGISPINATNPLTLTPVITGEEPNIVTFEVPINYNQLGSAGVLNLNLNGIDATLEEVEPAPNGNTYLSWNTTYDPPRQHYLQACLKVSYQGKDTAVVAALGKAISFDSSVNKLRFFEGDSMFDNSGAYLDALLSVQNASYTIDLYDPSTTPPTLLKTIQNTTSNGMIREDWNLVCNNQTVFTGDTFHAYFNVSTGMQAMNAPGTPNGPKKELHKIVATEQGNNFDFAYFYMPTNDNLATAYAKNGVVWNGMQGAVDYLIADFWGFDAYKSSFNRDSFYYSPGGPYPGYITSRADVTNSLLPDLANPATRNLYIKSHGTTNSLGNYNSSVYMTAYEVAKKLGNEYNKHGLCVTNPYRFVFLDACSTAGGKDWRRAFGIMPVWATNQTARYKLGPQAYVGWEGVHTGWMGPNSTNTLEGNLNVAGAYTKTLNKFFFDWMCEYPLAACIDEASIPAVNMAPFVVPKNKCVTIQGDTRSATGNSYTYVYTNLTTSKIYVVGHSGLTRSGIDTTWDGIYAAPENNQ